MFYKIINNTIDVDFDDHLLMPATPYYTHCHLTWPYTKVDAYKYLPSSMVNQETVNHFQDKLQL